MRFLSILLLLGASCNGDPGALTLEPLTDDQRGPSEENGRRRIGAHRPLADPLPGAWTEENESAVWRMEIRSPEAAALRLHFTDFHLPGGAVLVYEAEEHLRPDSERRYVGDGPGGDGEFWSDLIEGEAAIVEYRPAAGESARAVPFRIEEISHLWISPLDAF